MKLNDGTKMVHRSTQVGMDTIKAIEDGNATITISEEIPVARQRADEYKGNVTLYSKMMESRRIACNIVKQMDTFFKYKFIERQNYSCLSR